MIRVYLRRKNRDELSGYEGSSLTSVDVVCPALEEVIATGGPGGASGYLVYSVEGAEILPADGDRLAARTKESQP